MLSDEEKKAIEDVIEMIELHKDECLITTEDDFDNLEILLNLIEKQSKEIEELKEEKAKRQWVYIKENGELEPLFYVSKAKIKAKIEECRKILYSFEKELELKANKEQFIHKESMNCLLGQISILQSLLEEEE